MFMRYNNLLIKLSFVRSNYYAGFHGSTGNDVQREKYVQRKTYIDYRKVRRKKSKTRAFQVVRTGVQRHNPKQADRKSAEEG